MTVGEMMDAALSKEDGRHVVATSESVSRDHNSRQALAQLHGAALERQADAFQAWSALLRAHVDQGSPWLTIVRCALMSGLSLAELRTIAGASPSTMSRWLSGQAEPSRMLRVRLVDEIAKHVGGVPDKLRSRASELLKALTAKLRRSA